MDIINNKSHNSPVIPNLCGYCLLILLILVFYTTDGLTQLSPGDLHKSHAHLEGLKNCSECHGIGQKIAQANCLKCHQLLRERINSNQGLHAQPGFEACEKCHVEHHGRDFELIYWENGQENFNHQQTGFALEGKHLTNKCRDCHQEKFIADKEKFLEAKKDLDKTFLGLKKQCLNCHQDEHRGQLSSECVTCHTLNSWKPAERWLAACILLASHGMVFILPTERSCSGIRMSPTSLIFWMLS